MCAPLSVTQSMPHQGTLTRGQKKKSQNLPKRGKKLQVIFVGLSTIVIDVEKINILFIYVVAKIIHSLHLFAGHMNTLDIRSLLQDDAIEHVEMSEAVDETIVKEPDDKSDLSQNDEEEVRWRHCNNNNHIDKSMKKVCNQ